MSKNTLSLKLSALHCKSERIKEKGLKFFSFGLIQKFTSSFFIFIVSFFILTGCSGGGSDSGGSSITTSTTNIQGQATLGSLSGAKIVISDFNNNILGSGSAKTSQTDFDVAGQFDIAMNSSKLPEIFLMSASGGRDINYLDDDDTNNQIDNNGTIHAIVTKDDILNGKIIISPLTELFYGLALKQFGNDLSAVKKDDMTAFLNAQSKNYLTVPNATYKDVLSFNPRTAKATSKIPWQKVLSLVVNSIHKGEPSFVILDKFSIVKTLAQPNGITESEDNSTIKQFSDDTASGSRVVTKMQKDDDNITVSIFTQKFIAKDGAVVNLFVKKINSDYSYIDVTVTKDEHTLEIKGKTTLLQGLVFDKYAISNFINSLVNVDTAQDGSLQITIDKKLTNKLSANEVKIYIDGREPTSTELSISEDDPIIKWSLLESNKSAPVFTYQAKDGVNATYLENGTLILEMSIPMFDKLSGLDKKKHAISIGSNLLPVLNDILSTTAELMCTAYSVGAAVPCTVNSIIGMKLLADDIKTVAEGVDTLRLQARPSTLTGLIGKKTSNGNIIIGESYQPIIYFRNASSAGGMFKVYDERLNFCLDTLYKYYLDDDAAYAPNLISVNEDFAYLFSYKVSKEKGYIVFPGVQLAFMSELQSNKYTYMKAQINTVLNKPINASWNNDYFASANEESVYTDFTYKLNSSKDTLTLDASSSIAPKGETLSYEWLNALGLVVYSGEKASIPSSSLIINNSGTTYITLETTSSSGKTGKKTIAISGFFNSTNIKYGTVTSPFTGRIWLDRNLGASRVCTSYNDTACYGDYYQWGRNADGHEKSSSAITTTVATSLSNAGNKFIYAGGSNTEVYDWADFDNNYNIRKSNWSKADGSSVCPVGFRVPTLDEFKAEMPAIFGSSATPEKLFNNFLKIPFAGSRRPDNGHLAGDQGKVGDLWINSISSYRTPGVYHIENQLRSYGGSDPIFGFPVRCIKN